MSNACTQMIFYKQLSTANVHVVILLTFSADMALDRQGPCGLHVMLREPCSWVMECRMRQPVLADQWPVSSHT